MNIIKINSLVYKLPSDPQNLRSVLNHIDMCKKGLKKFVKLYNLDDNEIKISAFELQNSKIHTTIIDNF